MNSKKIVFFHATKAKSVGGFENQCLEYGSYLAEHTNYEVFYINHLRGHSKENNRFLSSKLKILDIDSCDFAKFEGATFVIAPNYVCFLLIYLKKLSSAKVCVWFTHPENLNWLQGQFFNLNSSVKEFCELLSEKKAALFMDQVNNIATNSIVCSDIEGNLVPVALDHSSNDKPILPIINKDRISIGWLGRLDSDKINSVINLLNNLRYSEISKKIDFHLVGDGNAVSKIKMRNYAPEIRFIFTSYLYDDVRDDYLRENVDIVIAMGVSALNCAKAGLPVLVPIVENRYFTDDAFVFLFDTKGYSLGWTSGQLHELGCKTYTISEALDLIYASDKPDNTKAILANRCRDFCRNNFSIDKNYQILLESLSGTDLTLEDLRHCKPLSEQLSWYKRYKKLTNGRSYHAFSKFCHRPRVFQYKHGIDKYAYLAKEIKRTLDANAKKKSTENDEMRLKRFKTVHKHYESVLQSIRKKCENGSKVKVAFLVVFSGVFAFRPLFEAMKSDPCFDPYIIIVPNVSRAMPYQRKVFSEAFSEYKKRYPGFVLPGYNETNGECIDISEQYDLICFGNPYDSLVSRVHKSSYFVDKNVLTIYASYAFCALKFWDEAIRSDFYNLMWRVCLENEENQNYLASHQLLKGKNGIVTGYLKMDKLAKINTVKAARKKIMICPHHTVEGVNSKLAVSNFVQYAEFFIDLPKKYPDIDFVFRPHPLLFDNLVAAKVWSHDQVESYLDKLLQSPNVLYDKSSDYLETFASSDAMIHDCGSFIAEYLYTEKPCCYLLKSPEQLETTLLPIGRSCLDNYYKALSEEDILQFIDEVVVAEIDPLKEGRERFSRDALKVNYPYATNVLLDYLKKELNQIS